MIIFLIRHFQTKGNLEGKYIGITDECILPVVSAKAYPKVDSVFTSPLKRCVETATIIYPTMVCTKNEMLKEINFGEFEQKCFKELEGNLYYKKWIKSGGMIPFPNGEVRADFIKRSVEGFTQCLKKDGEKKAFVVHGGTIMAILSHFCEGDFYSYQVKNGCGYMLSFENNKMEILGEI